MKMFDAVVELDVNSSFLLQNRDRLKPSKKKALLSYASPVNIRSKHYKFGSTSVSNKNIW